MEKTLTLLDTTGIQDYIFGSNRLRENVTASFLVELATDDWIRALLRAYPQGSNRLIFRGGGNVAILFDRAEDAKQVVRDLSRKLLIESPGLQLIAAHHTFDDTQHALGGADGVYAQLSRKIRTLGQQRRDVHALAGLGVTRLCRSTGQPAVGEDQEEPGRPVSAEVAAKTNRRYRNAADRRLYKFLRRGGVTRDLLRRYAFSRDLDELGRTHGESSYIAVVHADGNGMGRRFEALRERYPSAADNDRLLAEIERFYKALEDAGRQALQRTLLRLIIALDDDPAFADLKRSLALAPDGRPYLPLRPIVFGGDDVTVVCDGRLGLTFAATYLEEFQSAAANLPDEKPGYACAGVAIVKTHYPFARAYALSTELCDASKDLVHAEAVRREPGFDAAALDWHIAVGGIAAPLSELRNRLYRVKEGLLTHRPLFRAGIGWESWDALAKTVGAFDASDWRERRNKVMALREALRAGREATRAFRAAYGVDELPLIDGVTGDDYRRSGWLSNRDGLHDVCAYFDAIEALDFYLPLPSVEVTP
ncbi:MAG: hypothetical protein HC822_24310 [Oscillochloris sp.]|nr:hypothetical protein [Oscillochloris sp.]